MTWPADADLPLSAGIGIFGQAVTYTPLGGSPAAQVGIFDAAYQLVTLGGDVEIDAVGPVLGVRLVDFATAPAQGDTAVIGATTYQVRSVQRDGQGGAALFLKELY